MSAVRESLLRLCPSDGFVARAEQIVDISQVRIRDGRPPSRVRTELATLARHLERLSPDAREALESAGVDVAAAINAVDAATLHGTRDRTRSIIIDETRQLFVDYGLPLTTKADGPLMQFYRLVAAHALRRYNPRRMARDTIEP